MTATRSGNGDPVLTPHGVCPVGGEGEGRWSAIACHDDAWPALVDVAGFGTSWRSWDTARRRAEEATIAAALSGWTTGQDPGKLTERLQAAGVAGHTVQHSPDVISDAQLLHRSTPVQVPTPVRARCGSRAAGLADPERSPARP